MTDSNLTKLHSLLKKIDTAQSEIDIAHAEIDLFFELSIDLLAIADRRGFYLKLSKSWEDTLGYTREELMAQPYTVFLVEEDLGDTLDAMRQLNLGEPLIDFVNTYRAKDGHLVKLSWRSAAPNESGQIYAVARVIE